MKRAMVLGLLLMAGAVAAKEPAVGQPAPDFRVTTFDGREIKLSDLKGQVVVLNYWATWCGPCKKELPLLDGYYRAMRAHGLAVLAVTTEDSVPISRLRPLAKDLAIDLARHFRGPYAPIGHQIPSNFVVDRAGVLRYAQAGMFELADLNRILVPLLREPAAPPEPSGQTIATAAKP